MVFGELNAEAIHGAIINGCHRLMGQLEELNRINVFPVANSDTGDNMASVCAAIIEYSEIKEDSTLTLESIGQAAIIGSRDNSGILLTQFFLGLHQYLPKSNNLSKNHLCSALKRIAEEIDSVLSTPVEGTIITIIKKLSGFANSQNETDSIAKTMSIITPMLKKEVEKTATTLKIVRELKVVDAGALGFYYLLIRSLS